jgi:hypothetical protein
MRHITRRKARDAQGRGPHPLVVSQSLDPRRAPWASCGPRQPTIQARPVPGGSHTRHRGPKGTLRSSGGSRLPRQNAGLYNHDRFQTDDVMNSMAQWPKLTENERRVAETFGVQPLSNRQRAIKELREVADKLQGLPFGATCATIADKLQGPPFEPPA